APRIHRPSDHTMTTPVCYSLVAPLGRLLLAMAASGVLLSPSGLSASATGDQPARDQTTQAQQLEGQPPATFRIASDLVMLDVVVRDRRGRPVLDIPASSFTIREDGVRQSMTLLQWQDVPASVGLVIDTSGSMRDRHPLVSAAALTFIQALKPDDQAF